MLTVIRYTLLTAMRDKLFLGLLTAIALVYGLAVFTGSTALSEQQHMMLALFAGGSRITLVIGLIVFVCFHVRRAFDNREIESILSKPISRTQFIMGYWLGFVLIAAFMLIPIAVIALNIDQTNLIGLAVWCMSLLCETIVIIAFALLCSIMLKSAVSAVMASFAFYFISRLMGFFVAALFTQESMLGVSSGIASYAVPLIKAISTVIPRLDLYAKSNWMIYGIAQEQDVWIFPVQSLVFILLLLAMAVFDLKRKEF